MRETEYYSLVILGRELKYKKMQGSLSHSQECDKCDLLLPTLESQTNIIPFNEEYDPSKSTDMTKKPVWEGLDTNMHNDSRRSRLQLSLLGIIKAFQSFLSVKRALRAQRFMLLYSLQLREI